MTLTALAFLYALSVFAYACLAAADDASDTGTHRRPGAYALNALAWPLTLTWTLWRAAILWSARTANPNAKQHGQAKTTETNQTTKVKVPETPISKPPKRQAPSIVSIAPHAAPQPVAVVPDSTPLYDARPHTLAMQHQDDGA